MDTHRQWLGLIEQFGLADTDYYRGYHFEGKSAIRHLLKVACSLESLVIGEPQILGQLKEAYEWTKNSDLPLTSDLERALQLANQTAKRVRSENASKGKPSAR